VNCKAFALRRPISVYSEVDCRKRRSITELVLEALEEKLTREREEELRKGFYCLVEGDDQAAFWMEVNQSEI
jgi:hypothetical protein